MRIGVLAIQGGFEAHERALTYLGVESVQVRAPEDLASVEGLIFPGGESTTIAMGIKKYEFEEPIADFTDTGRAVFGTCGGLIVLSRSHLGLIDISATRNAYGRQIASFECEVTVKGLGDEQLRAVFIRAPQIDEVGESVEVLASHRGTPVVVRSDNVLATVFHPELTEDLRLHAYFLAMAGSREKLIQEGVE